MAGRIRRTTNLRLGLKIGARPERAEAHIGWAALRLRPKLLREEPGDPLEFARRAIHRWDVERDGPFTIFVYGDDEAYAASLGARDGLSLDEHRARVEAVAAALAGEGYDLTICEIWS
jgi:hypothetical protein